MISKLNFLLASETFLEWLPQFLYCFYVSLKSSSMINTFILWVSGEFLA